MKTKALYWLIGTLALVPLLNLLIYGVEGFTSESAIDINVHDTYYVISNVDLMLVLGVIVVFMVYLIRTLVNKFKNITANLILIISIIALLLVLAGISTMLDNFRVQNSQWTVNPPLSAGDAEPEVEPVGNNLDLFASLLFYLRIILLIFLAYCGFKTGRHYQPKS